MTFTYPEHHHPVFFLQDALIKLGADARFMRSEYNEHCWGLLVNGKPMVWLIDNRWPHEREHEDPSALKLQERGFLVCHAQKRDAERVGGYWLPLAASPGYTTPPSKPVYDKLYDTAFVGYVRDASRANTLIDLAAWCKIFIGQNLFGKDAVEAYWQSWSGLNIPTNFYHPDAYDINMRVFEVAATGTILITNELPELEELGFKSWLTCMTYDSLDEVPALVECASSGTYEWIAKRGAALIAERHTYRHRAEQVLTWLAE